ncbi:hypothetical protein KVR01_000091 [Diaporthe batatas]|uniref:uncharacterized protein n=1 Tax=Diaporthe batatas TaxID=748121 RepID=UPI001D03D4C0|nr:uncharacterized protein KVR01_000091 [Diaporthe batatas]KAG8169346.1 hypothetical protein KVR01_000091 [Diaporthe batatas]
MQITTLLTTAAIFVASASAQSAEATPTTTTAPTSTGSGSGSGSGSGGDLNSLISQLPQCAITCLDSSAPTIGCSASDLTCLCSKSDQLVTSIGTCILLNSGCSPEEQGQIQSLAGNLCSDVSAANPAELASASNFINSAIATGTTAGASIPTSSPTGSSSSGSSSSSSSENAAGRADTPLAGMSALGAVAAFAVLAL